MRDFMAVDIGSNSLKSLYVSCVDGEIVEKEALSLPLRISNGTSLVADAADKISYAIKHFRDSQAGDFDLRAIATSAMRDSANSEEICAKVFVETGVNVEVISGKREAYLSALGAIFDSNIKSSESFVFMDLGGGSLELALCENSKVSKVDSYPIGAVRLTEKFVASPREAIPQKALEEMGKFCKEYLKNFELKNNLSLSVGTGGAIAAAKYILSHLGLKNFEEALTLSDLEMILAKISQENMQSRVKNYAIPESRADIIPASFVCLITAMQEFKLRDMLYANQSLRRGLCAEHFNLA